MIKPVHKLRQYQSPYNGDDDELELENGTDPGEGQGDTGGGKKRRRGRLRHAPLCSIIINIL